METFIFRLKPGGDLWVEINRFLETNKVQAGFILTCAGSLQQTRIRFADQDHFTDIHGKHEIVALVGTLSIYGSHVHIALSDGEGRTIGGHIGEPGCLVYTTAEIVIGVVPGLRFVREPCAESGYDELVVRQAWSGPP